MADSTVTILPDGSPAFFHDYGSGGSSATCTPTGAADNWHPLQDSSDAQYDTIADVEPALFFGCAVLAVTLANPAVDADDQIKSVRVVVRHKATNTNNRMHFTVFPYDTRLGTPSSAHRYVGSESAESDVPTVTTNQEFTFPYAFDLEHWDQARLNALGLQLVYWGEGDPGAPKTDTYTLYEVTVYVYYNQPPVATVTDPGEGSTDSTTSQPHVIWTYSDPENDGQERYRVKIFSAAQYGAGGFDPETSTATWDSGVVYSAVNDVMVGEPLANSTTYRAYVKVGDVTPTGYAAKWSAWDYNQFTVSITPPGTPSIDTLTPQAASDSMLFTVHSGTLPAGPATQTVEVQASVDNGTTWETLYDSPLTMAASASQTMSDYQSARGATVKYRARATCLVGGLPISSDWSAASAGAVMPVSECAWLKSIVDPTKSIRLPLSSASYQAASDELQARFDPVGATTPIIHSIALTGEQLGELGLFFTSDAQWEAFEVLRKRREVLLLQTPYGETARDQYWVRLKKRTVTPLTFHRPGQQWRRVTVEASEVAAPV